METTIATAEIFRPFRRTGLLLHAGLSLLSAAAGGVCFWQLSARQGEPGFLWLLLLGILVLIPLPLLVYNLYGLLSATYTLERDGLRLRWGLRGEDIPLQEIEWLRNAEELGFTLPLPAIRLPGAVVGTRNVEGLGRVEFMASDVNNLLLVATPRCVFVISPVDMRAFERAFRRAMEMGSLSPMAAYSTQPVIFLRQMLADRWVRILLAVSVFLLIGLLVVVALQLPGRELVSLGFDSDGLPREAGPVQQLLLLPALGAVVLLVDLIGGMFLYHRWKQHLIAYLLWGASGLTSLLLILAALQIS
jgi:hypothetical protein